MKRAEFVQRLVLDAICDDFENVDQVILRDVAALGAKCGLVIERLEVIEALRGLVGAALAKTYDLCRVGADAFSGELEGMPPLDVVEEYFRTYFYVTDKGRELHETDTSWWPFDDEGSVRPGWKPPDE